MASLSRIDPCRAAGEDPLNRLRRRVAARHLLSADEEVRLARRIEQGDLDAKRTMVESNIRLVFALATTYRGRGVPLADLTQEGMIGLVRAVERFDHRRGCRFATYAMWWIRRSLRDAIASSQVIRMPARAGQHLAAVRRAEAELERAGCRSASNAAIAERTGLTSQAVRSLRSAARVTASLDVPVGDDGSSLGDLLADEHAIDPAEHAVRSDAATSVTCMLRLLPARHREVLERHYGLNDGRPQSHEQVGAWLGVGEERSRQLEREALHRLRTIATTSAVRAA